MGPTFRFTCPNILMDYRNNLIAHQCIDPFLKLTKIRYIILGISRWFKNHLNHNQLPILMQFVLLHQARSIIKLVEIVY